MNIIILTGSIATGKSTVLAQFKRRGFASLNADSVVHELLGKGGAAVEKVASAFPESVVAKGCPAYIDRKKLGNIVFNDARKLAQLEHILHPLVRANEIEWLKRQRRLGRKNVVIEIPLYFESRRRKNFTSRQTVVTTSASLWTIKQRALGRMHMTPTRLKNIMQRQWQSARKAAYADRVIHTGLGKAHAMRQVIEATHAKSQ